MKRTVYVCDGCGKEATVPVVVSLSRPRQVAEDDNTYEVQTDLCTGCACAILNKMLVPLTDEERVVWLKTHNKNYAKGITA